MFEGALICSVNDTELFHKAHTEFLRLVEEGQFAKSHTVKKRLEPGQCLVFNNRRMLHGHDVSDSGGGWKLKKGREEGGIARDLNLVMYLGGDCGLWEERSMQYDCCCA